jgi:hypothetical protein
LNFSTPCGPVALVFVKFVAFEGRFYCFLLNDGSSGVGESEAVVIVRHIDSYVLSMGATVEKKNMCDYRFVRALTSRRDKIAHALKSRGQIR